MIVAEEQKTLLQEHLQHSVHILRFTRQGNQLGLLLGGLRQTCAHTACWSTNSPVRRRFCSVPFISTVTWASMFASRKLPKLHAADSCATHQQRSGLQVPSGRDMLNIQITDGPAKAAVDISDRHLDAAQCQDAKPCFIGVVEREREAAAT